MSKTPSELLDYQSLKNKGLKLAENDFNTVFSTIIQGHDDTKRYLNVENDPNPAFRISDEDVSMGFSKTQDAINIHLGYLNLLSKNTTPIEYRDQLTCFVPDKFYVIFKYLYWLRLFGRESTIHYYQKHGNPKLKIAFPAVFPESISAKIVLLSDFEVEARKTIDIVAQENGENAVWKNVDEYFLTNFPDYYNMSVDQLSAMPKPKLEISFEMENIVG